MGESRTFRRPLGFHSAGMVPLGAKRKAQRKGGQLRLAGLAMARFMDSDQGRAWAAPKPRSMERLGKGLESARFILLSFYRLDVWEDNHGVSGKPAFACAGRGCFG